MPKKKASVKKIVVHLRTVPIKEVPILKVIAKSIGPWETDGMKRHDRILQFEAIGQGRPLKARCGVCHRPFAAKARLNEGTDDALLRMRADFEAHNCHEDAAKPPGS
ncbi:MAG: hypothetical protein WA213_02290 [Terriglobales bacterium]